jgi:hypothetical protein
MTDGQPYRRSAGRRPGCQLAGTRQRAVGASAERVPAVGATVTSLWVTFACRGCCPWLAEDLVIQRLWEDPVAGGVTRQVQGRRAGPAAVAAGGAEAGHGR